MGARSRRPGLTSCTTTATEMRTMMATTSSTAMRVWRDVQCRLRIGSTLASMIVAPSAFTPSALPSPERLPSRVSLILALAPFYGCDAKQRQQCGFARFGGHLDPAPRQCRSEEHTSELQSLMRISYAVFCLKK